jgi:inorganic pyrophosphatase
LELYGILPYKDDKERKNALGTLREESATLPDIPGIDQVRKVYIADKIPITEKYKDGSVLPSYYFH